jgi:hypothetical protein
LMLSNFFIGITFHVYSFFLGYALMIEQAG